MDGPSLISLQPTSLHYSSLRTKKVGTCIDECFCFNRRLLQWNSASHGLEEEEHDTYLLSFYPSVCVCVCLPAMTRGKIMFTIFEVTFYFFSARRIFTAYSRLKRTVFVHFSIWMIENPAIFFSPKPTWWWLSIASMESKANQTSHCAVGQQTLTRRERIVG